MNQSAPACQPRSLLYAIAAGIGGSGLDAVAFESLQLAHRGGFLGCAVTLSNNQTLLPPARIDELRLHPVKTLSFLPRPYYMGAKKHAVDARAAAHLRTGRYDLFHGWSGDAIASLREAGRRGIPSVIEIPTWHRNKGKTKPPITRAESERAAAPFPQSILNRMLVSRQQVLEEYDRATLLLVLSERARETFLAAGIPSQKLFMMHRGVDPAIFTPAEHPPENFRAVFAGALLRRKGVHVLLDAWKRAALEDAELVLVGAPQPELAAELRDLPVGVRLAGHVRDVAAEFRKASLHVLPSELEGSAKVTYEAAACGLPQIVTRESGDIVVDGLTGWIIPPNNPEALESALRTAAADPALRARMGAAARHRIVNHFTWDHARARLAEAYAQAIRSHASTLNAQ